MGGLRRTGVSSGKQFRQDARLRIGCDPPAWGRGRDWPLPFFLPYLLLDSGASDLPNEPWML